MSLLALGGFNLLCYWASKGADLLEKINTQIDFLE